ncbi:hypothetical protein C1H46_017390 [Malus baccata]|uniref:glucan endo-1,3-beta-D-glucosidase n=1 Tax=Malus baccata TaxID=106549 RepID=A0A540ME36_MALBA|nr:hypothetical protein C1H46_017390 [Malus baccata]
MGGPCRSGFSPPAHPLPLSFHFQWELASKVGVNYGQLGNNLPPPSQSVKLIQSLKAKRVKLYDANPKILTAFRNADL